MIKTQVNQAFNNYRLDKYLCQRFDISFAVAQKIIREKKIKINGQKISNCERIYLDDKIEIFANLIGRIEKTPHHQKVPIKKIENFYQQYFAKPLFEDQNIVAINKPSGIACQGGSSIDFSIDDVIKTKNYQLIHRLDKDTSGVLVIAKNQLTADLITDYFKQKQIEKTYYALVYGVVKKDNGIIDIALIKKNLGKNDKVLPDPISGKQAITHFEVLERFNDFSLLKLMPLTGRTHQLRVHCKEIGHPIINDIKYGGIKVLKKQLANNLCLYAHQLIINNYNSQKLTITADLPEFLIKFKKYLK
jgi:23S rRNA pseudouridine955/2504/2580 synthase